MAPPVRQSRKYSLSGRTLHVSEELASIARGDTDLSEWTDEQIENCRKSLRGKPPSMVPYQLVQEFQRRTRDKAQQRLHDLVTPALDALRDIVQGADVDEKDRLTAVKMILERSLGREPLVVEARVEASIETVARGMVVDDRSGFEDNEEDG